ncbi:precorrin-2 C(20)-methyltransferase [Phytohalomonas tamaricis]|uniref:precorrin-2 C(20)-methyltransferase n=1 Tax=Phytohalomonas tamaricis TaxID=2081032 RepID=UPI000D0BCA14|nr:precorrin-2 C(20)-methyltransferase [Phytohalomonas tamaricis]
MASATFYGIGIGPGDPELITLKAHRTLQRVDAVAYIVNAEGYSLAADIARESLPASQRQKHLKIRIEMCSERTQINRVYDTTAEQIAELLEAGRDVAFLCEGDPLFYGSFAYLLDRLAARYPCQVIPGISSLQAASAAALLPTALLTENLAVISARCTENELLEALARFDNLIILKGGRQRARVKVLIEQSGRLRDGLYLEYLSHPHERRVFDLRELPDEPGPYFSLFMVSRRHGQRPQ